MKNEKCSDIYNLLSEMWKNCYEDQENDLQEIIHDFHLFVCQYPSQWYRQGQSSDPDQDDLVMFSLGLDDFLEKATKF